MKLAQMDLDYELKMLDKTPVSDAVKDRIREFLLDLKLEGITEVRRKNYCQRLRKVAEWIPDKFLDPDKESIKKVLGILSGDKKTRLLDGKDTMKPAQKYSEWTYVTYINMIKRFYKWHLGNNTIYPECVSWIKRPKSPNGKVMPDSLITQDEIRLLVQNAKNNRDRALFYTLYDSGCRISELLTLRIKDVAFDDYGALLHVTGKTGYRQVRIVGNSIAYLRAWKNDHPFRSDPDTVMFCGLSDSIRGRQLTYDDVYAIIRKTTRRAGIKRRIYPHLFRHTRATLLASNVPEAPLEAQMGWIHGSRQTRTYVHLSGRDQDKAILKAYGVKVDDDGMINEERPDKCPRCGSPNAKGSDYCSHCWLPLSTRAVIELQEKQDKIADRLYDEGKIKPDVMAIIKRMPENEKTGILSTIIEDALKERENLKKQS